MAETAPSDKYGNDAPVVDPAPVGGIAGAALIIMFGNVLSRLLGMAREQLAAGLFGTGDRIAAFTVADNVHTLLFDLLISGMLQAALVPVLAQWTAPDAATREELRRISGALLTLAALVVGAMVVVGMIFAPAIVEVMTALGGDAGERGAATTDLTVTLVRMILPAVFFLAIGVVLMGVLYALGRVTAPALSIGVRNAAIVASIALLSGALGVKSMALGVVAGGIAIAAINAAAAAGGGIATTECSLHAPGGAASAVAVRADLPGAAGQYRRGRRRSQPRLGSGGDALGRCATRRRWCNCCSGWSRRRSRWRRCRVSPGTSPPAMKRRFRQPWSGRW